MALTQFAFCQLGVGFGANVLEVPVASTVTSEGIAPSGSNQQTTATAPTGIAELVCRVTTDTAVYVAFGANPNASTGAAARFFMPIGSVGYFRVNPGDKAAVVNI
jgi:hypothetical protein